MNLKWIWKVGLIHWIFTQSLNRRSNGFSIDETESSSQIAEAFEKSFDLMTSYIQWMILMKTLFGFDICLINMKSIYTVFMVQMPFFGHILLWIKLSWRIFNSLFFWIFYAFLKKRTDSQMNAVKYFELNILNWIILIKILLNK